MALLLSSLVAALVPSWLVHRAWCRERARHAWRPAAPTPSAVMGDAAHEHRYGPAKPCWRDGFYEQRCTVTGCPVTRHRRLDHVQAERAAAGEERVGFTTRG